MRQITPVKPPKTARARFGLSAPGFVHFDLPVPEQVVASDEAVKWLLRVVCDYRLARAAQ